MMCWTSMKLKNFCSLKYTFLHKIRKLKKQPTHRQGENIFKPFIYVGSNTHKELPPRYIYIYVYMHIYKTLFSSTIRKQTTGCKHGQNMWTDIIKENIQGANKHMKICPPSYVIKELYISRMKYPCPHGSDPQTGTPVVAKDTEHGTLLYCWWRDCRIALPFQKTIWQLLVN